MTFDTDVLIWFSRGEPEATVLVNATQDPALSIVALMEILQGSRSKQEMKAIKTSLSELRFRVLPLSEAIGNTAAALIEEHALSNGLHLEDALIAATAIESGEVLVSANDRHFKPIRRLALKTFRPRRTR